MLWHLFFFSHDKVCL